MEFGVPLADGILQASAEHYDNVIRIRQSLVFSIVSQLILKPNSITLAGSKVVADQLRTCLRPA